MTSDTKYSEWDETITVGTLITGYYKGFWILSRIQFREPSVMNPDGVPIFHMTKVLNDDGTKSKALQKSCHAGYCKKITRENAVLQRHNEIDQANKKLDALLQFVA